MDERDSQEGDIVDSLLKLLTRTIIYTCKIIGSSPSERAISSFKYSIITGLLVFACGKPFNSLLYFPSVVYMIFFIGSVIRTNKKLRWIVKKESVELRNDVLIGKFDRLYGNDLINAKFMFNDLKDIVESFEPGGLPPKFQEKLLLNNWMCKQRDTRNYIINKLLSTDYWKEPPIIRFIGTNKDELLDLDLKKFYEKYVDSKSIKFTLGRYQDIPNIEELTGDDFAKAGMDYRMALFNIYNIKDFFMGVYLMSIIIAFFVIILRFSVPQNIILIILSSFAILIFIYPINQRIFFDWSVIRILKKNNIDMSNNTKKVFLSQLWGEV